MSPRASFEKGVFTLSFDLELIWGTVDLYGPEAYRDRCLREREEVIGRLLELLARFDVPATWCVVGHLLLDRCPDPSHPEIVPPRHRWVRGDWFGHDPGGTEATAPTFLARSVIERIRSCSTPQEIGSHSFSHVIFGDPGCSAATADGELAACVRAAAAMGLELRSLVFPRNRVGHLEALEKHGFTCYRGPERKWHGASPMRELLERAVHLLELVGAWTPPVVWPEEVRPGLFDIPGSMVLLPMHGVRRYVPVATRVARGRKGLEAAASSRGIFHLWTHPTSFVDHQEAALQALGEILAAADLLRRQGRLEVLPMGAIADRARADRGNREAS